jgi:4-amino-4-deoxy-L-arabinose transferase-like glycosyltransferase
MYLTFHGLAENLRWRLREQMVTLQTSRSGAISEALAALRAYRVLLLLFILAFFLRVLYMMQAVVIETEGVEYARIAENLFHGKGYRGILGGREAMFPPLLPVTIGLVSVLTGDAERSGRLISLIAGTLLLAPVLLIARQLFGGSAAVTAVALAAFHPLLIALSGSVYSEGPYFTVLLAGLFWTLRSLQLDSPRSGFWAGLYFGLAYLLRPEAVAYVVLAVIVILGRGLIEPRLFRGTLKTAGILVGTTAILMLPYVLYLSVNAGQIRIEGKTLIIDAIGQRMLDGMSYSQAARGLTPDLKEEGPTLIADQFAIPPAGIASKIRLIMSEQPRRWRETVSAVLSNRALGSPVLAILFIVGLLLRKRSSRWFAGEAFLLLVAGAYFVMLASVHFFWQRYLFPFLPLMLLFAAAGVESLSAWAERIVGSLLSISLGRFAAHAVRWALSVALLFISFSEVSRLGEFTQQRDVILKEAGQWLNTYKAGPKKIMGIGAVVPYYAEGTLISLPYTDADSALAYIHKKNPAFIVLRPREVNLAPYLASWVREGIPDECASLVRRMAGVDSTDAVLIYEWNCSRTSPERT